MWYNIKMKRFWAVYGLMPIIFGLILIIAGQSAPSAAAPGLISNDTVIFETFNDDFNPNDIFGLVNEVRSKQGVSELRADDKLAHVALLRAQDMAGRQYYAHKNPDGKYYFDHFKPTGIESGYSCENLDLVFVASQELVIDEWMNSMRGHRQCMMNADVTHAGYAATEMTLVNFDNTETTAYLVVAIHARLEH